MNDILIKMRQHYPTLSKGQKQIATFILENYDRAAFLTAARLGELADVSESTVVRFASTMGFRGYPALQRALQEYIRTKLTATQRMELTGDMPPRDVLQNVLKADMQNLRATIEAVDNDAFLAAMEALLEARHVYVVGLRSAMPLAQFLAYYLGFVCDMVVPVTGALGDVFEQMARIGAADVCICISFPRYSVRAVEALALAKERGAATIAITDGPGSPLIAHADYLLTARSDMASFADSLVAPLSLINAIIAAAGIARREELMEHFTQLEGVWGSHHTYVHEQLR